MVNKMLLVHWPGVTSSAHLVKILPARHHVKTSPQTTISFKINYTSRFCEQALIKASIAIIVKSLQKNTCLFVNSSIYFHFGCDMLTLTYFTQHIPASVQFILIPNLFITVLTQRLVLRLFMGSFDVFMWLGPGGQIVLVNI